MKVNPLAGKPAPESLRVDIPKLITAFTSLHPDLNYTEQRVCFGTSGHRGSSFTRSFNEGHILAIVQAICDYRQGQNIRGPLFLGMDTHALAYPAYVTSLEVLVANGIDVQIAVNEEYTPTPVLSHAILTYNDKKPLSLADGIGITPSHNPPKDCGIKYNPPNGGPAEVEITRWIENRANELLKVNLEGVKRIPYENAAKSPLVHSFDFVNHYISDLGNVIDMEIIHNSQLHFAVDPLGGAGVHYWKLIGEKYQIPLKVLSEAVDPTFMFMAVDWDGQIRMDPSSPYAMALLAAQKDNFDLIFACDTDHDRHGIVAKSTGLMNPNHYLTVAADYLFKNRPQWPQGAQLAKTIVTSQTLDRVARKLNRKVYETPVGFKWFVDGLLKSSIGFCGEESAGASFLRRNGTVWTTDKDGMIAGLLAAEITASTGKDPGQLYNELTDEIGVSYYDRVEGAANFIQKERLLKLSPEQITTDELAGEKITACLTKASGNGASIGGLKVETENSWFAARPSGTENIYKIYGESFISQKHLQSVLSEAQVLVDKVLRE